MMRSHVSQNLETGDGFHADIGHHDVRLNRIELLNRLRGRSKWKDLLTFFPAHRVDDFHHRRLVIDDYDFCHSQRGEYFKFEKRKGETEKLCWFAADHHPRHL